MGEKEYYEKFWSDNLPDREFFGGLPDPNSAKTCFNIVKQICDKEEKILDYGTGEGYLVGLMQKNGFKVWGSDISELAIKVAKIKFPKGRFYTLTEKLPIVFDTILVFDVLEHVFDFDEVFDYINSHIRKCGKLIVATNETSCIKMFIIGLFLLDKFFHPYSPHIRFFTRNTLKELLESKGYEVVVTKRRGNFFGFLSTGQIMVAVKQ